MNMDMQSELRRLRCRFTVKNGLHLFFLSFRFVRTAASANPIFSHMGKHKLAFLL